MVNFVDDDVVGYNDDVFNEIQKNQPCMVNITINNYM